MPLKAILIKMLLVMVNLDYREICQTNVQTLQEFIKKKQAISVKLSVTSNVLYANMGHLC